MSISRLWGNFFYQSQDLIIDRLERICLLQPHIVFMATQERQCQKMSSSAMQGIIKVAKMREHKLDGTTCHICHTVSTGLVLGHYQDPHVVLLLSRKA